MLVTTQKAKQKLLGRSGTNRQGAACQAGAAQQTSGVLVVL